MDSRTRVQRIATVHIIITEDSIIIETPIAIAGSETRIMVIRTIRETKTTADSEILMAGSETKTAVIRTARELRITADSETRTVAAKTAADQNLPAVDSETAPAAKAVVQTDNRAAEAALDKTIINKKTNS